VGRDGSFVAIADAAVVARTAPFTQHKLTVHHVISVDPSAVAAGLAFKSIDASVKCAVMNEFDGYFIDQKLDQIVDFHEQKSHWLSYLLALRQALQKAGKELSLSIFQVRVFPHYRAQQQLSS
jgi:hypothetical protein